MTDIIDEKPARPADEPEEVVVDVVDDEAASRPGPADGRLEAAWEHLRRNELDDAVAIAEVLVRERPDAPEPKLVLARSFINRREYQKALTTLQTIPESVRNADAYYYLGLCRSRMADKSRALEALEKSVAAATDESSRRRARELMGHLRGDTRIVCPECGKSASHGAMVEIGNKTVCADCADRMADRTPPAPVPAHPPVDPTVNPSDKPVDRPTVKPPAHGESGLGRRSLRRGFCLLLFLALALALAYAGVYAFSEFSPDRYAAVRSRLPESWTFLPAAGSGPRAPDVPSDFSGERLSADIRIDSPKIEHAVSGLPIRHRLSVDGMQGLDGDFTALFSPEPRGRHRIDARTGEFSWTPAEEDVGRRFSLTFGVAFKNARAREQVNSVRVFSVPRFRVLHHLFDPEPGDKTFLFSADVTGDGRRDVIAVAGGFWDGTAAVLEETVDGLFHPQDRVNLPGRPVGAGLLSVAGKPWLAVADYWNSRLHYYVFENGRAVEAPVEVAVPGKPLLAAFDGESGLSAVLCRLDGSTRLVGHRAVDRTHVEKVGDWEVPAGHVWRSLLYLPEGAASGPRARALLIGSEPGRSVFLATPERGELLPVRVPVGGNVVNAALAGNGRVKCLVELDGKYSLVAFDVDGGGIVSGLRTVYLPGGPFLNGMVGLDLFGGDSGAGKGDDVALLSATKLALVFSHEDGGVASEWELPAPSGLFGPMTILTGAGGGPDGAVYLDAAGDLWCVGLSAEAD